LIGGWTLNLTIATDTKLADWARTIARTAVHSVVEGVYTAADSAGGLAERAYSGVARMAAVDRCLGLFDHVSLIDLIGRNVSGTDI
jgi:hypothetical protein